jgi:DNA-binding MarR family transcriptional regulator
MTPRRNELDPIELTEAITKHLGNGLLLRPFLIVAEWSDTKSADELAKMLKTSNPTMGRYLDQLGNKPYRDPNSGEAKQGLGLIETDRDPMDRRRRIAKLTKKGEKALADLKGK